MKATNEHPKDELCSEYDVAQLLKGAVRGKYSQR
jgi:hypothetical protein